MTDQERQSIRYYGKDVDGLLESMKLVTMRKPSSRYAIVPGTVIEADCVDVGIKMPLMVIANDTRALKDFPNYTLLLDGYPDAEWAAEDLAQYPTYGDVTVESEMQRIATIPLEVWQSLLEEQQQKLLTLGLEAAMKEPEFRRIFLWSLFQWVVFYGMTTYREWHNFLTATGLASHEEIAAKLAVPDEDSVEVRSDDDYDFGGPPTETLAFYWDTMPALGGLKYVLDNDHSSPEFRSVVLQEPVRIPFE